MDGAVRVIVLPRGAGPVQGSDNDPARQPREPTDHAGVRLLRRVSAQVRQRQRVEVLHRPVRLPAPNGTYREPNFLLAWRPVTQH